MTFKTTYTCDQCDKDLTYTGNCVDYRIGVYAENIPTRSCSVTLMNIEPPFDHDIHFCGVVCMKEYFMKMWSPKETA